MAGGVLCVWRGVSFLCQHLLTADWTIERTQFMERAGERWAVGAGLDFCFVYRGCYWFCGIINRWRFGGGRHQKRNGEETKVSAVKEKRERERERENERERGPL